MIIHHMARSVYYSYLNVLLCCRKSSGIYFVLPVFRATLDVRKWEKRSDSMKTLRHIKWVCEKETGRKSTQFGVCVCTCCVIVLLLHFFSCCCCCFFFAHFPCIILCIHCEVSTLLFFLSAIHTSKTARYIVHIDLWGHRTEWAELSWVSWVKVNWIFWFAIRNKHRRIRIERNVSFIFVRLVLVRVAIEETGGQSGKGERTSERAIDKEAQVWFDSVLVCVYWIEVCFSFVCASQLHKEIRAKTEFHQYKIINGWQTTFTSSVVMRFSKLKKI